MIKKYITTGLLLAITLGVNAQKTYWAEAGTFNSKGTTWIYNLGKGTGNAGDKFESGESSKNSVSSTATPGFLAYPPSGFASVTTGINAGGSFRVIGKNEATKLTIDASSNSSANKFSVYDISKASAVSSLFFTLSFNDNNPTNGAIVFGIGNARGNNIFKNAASLTGADASGLFAALRWEFSTNNNVFFSYRTLTNSYTYKLISPSVFKKTDEHKVELYLNNSLAEQTYTRGGKGYPLAKATLNIWVNGNLVSTDAGAGIPASGELAPEAPINSFLFQGYHSKGPFANALSITLGDIQYNSVK